MDRLIKYGSVNSIPYYNCSVKTPEEWAATGMPRPLLGWPIFIFGIFIEFLYVPIIYIIFKSRLIRHPCYKIILTLAFTDMSATMCSCFITGFLLIEGAVFCSYPTASYLAGGFVMLTWCVACSTTVSLFINRIISIAFQNHSDFLEKKLAYGSIVLCFIYGNCIMIFTPTVCYNSVIMAWLPDPLTIDPEDKTQDALDYYRNTSQAWNNWIFVSSMFILFTIYFFMVKRLAKGQKSKASKAIFIQCSIICFFNTTAAMIYNVLSFVQPAPWILVVGQLAWSINHGCPAMIYVTMNDTIRKEFKKLVFRTHKKKVDQTSTAITSQTDSRI